MFHNPNYSNIQKYDLVIFILGVIVDLTCIYKIICKWPVMNGILKVVSVSFVVAGSALLIICLRYGLADKKRIDHNNTVAKVHGHQIPVNIIRKKPRK